MLSSLQDLKCLVVYKGISYYILHCLPENKSATVVEVMIL